MMFVVVVVFLGNASFLQTWPRFRAIFATKVGVEKTSLHTLTIKQAVSREKNNSCLEDGLASEIHIVVIQGLIVCLFLLNYFSFKNMEMESVKSRYFMQLKKNERADSFSIWVYIYKYFSCIMTKLGV